MDVCSPLWRCCINTRVGSELGDCKLFSMSYPLLLFLFCAKAWGPLLVLSLSPAPNPKPILLCLCCPAWFRPALSCPALPCPALPCLCFGSGKVLPASSVCLRAITASLARVSTTSHWCSHPAILLAYSYVLTLIALSSSPMWYVQVC